VLLRVGRACLCVDRAGRAAIGQGRGGILVFGNCGYYSSMDGSTRKKAGVMYWIAKAEYEKPESNGQRAVNVETIVKMEWTTDPPTDETNGVYWVKTAETQVIIPVHASNGMAFIFGISEPHEFSDFTHWLGPLPVPDTPK
jgi:hypothetical protein